MSSQSIVDKEQRGTGKTRLEAFLGVVATIIAIIVLEIKVPTEMTRHGDSVKANRSDIAWRV